MPTGYTSSIYEGKEVSRNDFILGCARAFGALIEMRDSPSDTPIPDEFTPRNYHIDAIEKAKAELLVTYTIEEAQAILDEEYEKKVENNEKRIEEIKGLIKRYEDMKQEILAWVAPSEEHQGLKDFCIKQLEDSMEFDCNYSYYSKLPVKESAELWIINKREQVEKNLKYHEEEWKKELDRISSRNHWVRLLKNSLV
jgi:hypothetical protein